MTNCGVCEAFARAVTAPPNSSLGLPTVPRRRPGPGLGGSGNRRNKAGRFVSVDYHIARREALAEVTRSVPDWAPGDRADPAPSARQPAPFYGCISDLGEQFRGQVGCQWSWGNKAPRGCGDSGFVCTHDSCQTNDSVWHGRNEQAIPCSYHDCSGVSYAESIHEKGLARHALRGELGQTSGVVRSIPENSQPFLARASR
ncbi:hypothetical protein MAPG_04400 [Magnaporthiopsis poae ATCC 64411]|uniref:Uncharacterized protein n=1 Tax=Magnaporthiopsis poae (strain ATCC 64411 / 73-15) TaxID=644358 RepID=A0A0C4DWM1_MAGP6|nr:hypothetical protein MAPG_04400 [Magnaporthiopsis poae ATCC 64411]